jgi:hypothetical protein
MISGSTEVELHLANRGPFNTRIRTSLEDAVRRFAELSEREQRGCRILPVEQLKITVRGVEVDVDYFDTAACHGLARQLPEGSSTAGKLR